MNPTNNIYKETINPTILPNHSLIVPINKENENPPTGVNDSTTVSKSNSAFRTKIGLSKKEESVKTSKKMKTNHPETRTVVFSKQKKIRPQRKKDLVIVFDDLNEFKNRLATQADPVSTRIFPTESEKKLHFLERLFSKSTGDCQINTCWISMIPNEDPDKEVYVKIVLTQGIYESDALLQEEIPFSQDTYTYIELFEWIGEQDSDPTKIVRLRLGEHNGELIKIAKGKHLTGKQAVELAFCFHSFWNKPLYIYDDAHIKVSTTDVFLKTFAIGDSTGKTWYQRILPNTVPAEGTWTLPCGNQIDQTTYQEALDYVRTFKIIDLQLFFQCQKKPNVLLVILKKAFPELFDSSSSVNKLENSVLTVQQLAAKVEQFVKTAPHKSNALKQALKLQQELVLNVLEPSDEEDQKNFLSNVKKKNFGVYETAGRFLDSIRIISDSRVFICQPQDAINQPV